MFFQDAFNIKNHLKLSTPYAAFKELTSSFEFRIMMGHQYLLALDADYLNGSRWIKVRLTNALRPLSQISLDSVFFAGGHISPLLQTDAPKWRGYL